MFTVLLSTLCSFKGATPPSPLLEGMFSYCWTVCFHICHDFTQINQMRHTILLPESKETRKQRPPLLPPTKVAVAEGPAKSGSRKL